MRVLIAHSFYRQPGGEDRYVEQQSALLGTDHEVEVLSAANRDLQPGPRAAIDLVGSRSQYRRTLEAIRSFAPDVVHLHNPYPSLGPSVQLATRKLDLPLVMTVHNYRLRCPNGYMFTEGSICRRCEKGMYANAVIHRCFPKRSQAGAYALALWTHRFILRLERSVGVFIAPSHFVAKELVGWGLDRGTVRVVRNFTDTEPAATPNLGRYGAYVGRLSSEKGLDVLLRALKGAGDPPFAVVGDGPERAVLERLAAVLGLERTKFRGHLAPSEVAALMSEARFVAFPSVWHENAPLAALEAMAAGTPLLVADSGGLTELAADGRGQVRRAGDAGDLAAGIEDLNGDDELCRRMGEAALAFARSEFTTEVHKARLIEVYEEIRG